MKKVGLMTVVMLLVLAMVPCGAFAADNAINVTVDGVAVKWTDATPYIDANNRTMVPLRAIGEAIGVDVDWNQKEKTAAFKAVFTEAEAVSAGAIVDSNKDGKKDAYLAETAIAFQVNNKTAGTATVYCSIGGDGKTAVVSNDNTVAMDTAAVMKDNRTYAPARYLAEYFGLTVEWDKLTKTVKITSADATKTTEPAIKITEPAIKTTEPAIKTTEPAIKTTEPAIKTTDAAVKTTDAAVKTDKN